MAQHFPINVLYLSYRTHVKGLEPYQYISNTVRKRFLDVRTTYSTTLCTFVRFTACPTTETPIKCDISFMQLPSTSSRPTTDLTFHVLPIPPLGLLTF
jgi:hypothetical protein